MNALVITFVALAGMFLAVASFASLRPATREVVSSRTVYAPPPAMVQATHLDTSAQPARRLRIAQVASADDAGWTEVTKDGERTVLAVREEPTTPSPFGLIRSRHFLDPEAFAKTDLDDLAAEVARRQSQGS